MSVTVSLKMKLLGFLCLYLIIPAAHLADIEEYEKQFIIGYASSLKFAKETLNCNGIEAFYRNTSNKMKECVEFGNAIFYSLNNT